MDNKNINRTDLSDTDKVAEISVHQHMKLMSIERRNKNFSESPTVTSFWLFLKMELVLYMKHEVLI